VGEVGSEPHWLGLSRSFIALATAAVALAVSIPTGLYTVKPAWSPEKKEKVGAKLKLLTFDPNVSLREYLTRAPHTVSEGANLDKNGNVFYLRAAVEGFKREELRVRWFTYEKTNKLRIAKLSKRAPLEDYFRPQASVNTQIAQIWVPTSETSGSYFVRFELYTKDHVLLAYVDSTAFRVEAL